MERWRSIQHDRMFADHFIKDVPDFRTFLLDHLFSGLDGGGKSPELQLAKNKGLE